MKLFTDIYNIVYFGRLVWKLGKTVEGSFDIVQILRKQLEKLSNSVTFKQAVEAALKEREGRSTRTIQDFKWLSNRFLKNCEGLADKKIRTLTKEDCEMMIKKSFNTPVQRNKGRLVLSGIFSTAFKNGWVDGNIIRLIHPSKI